MANVVFNSFKYDVAGGRIDCDSDTFYGMVAGASYTPNQDSHHYRSDVTNEVSGTGYTAGGKALTGVTLTQDNTGNQAVWDCDDVSWPSSTITGGRWLIIYKRRGGASSADELCMALDFGSDFNSSNGTFLAGIDPTGLAAFA